MSSLTVTLAVPIVPKRNGDMVFIAEPAFTVRGASLKLQNLMFTLRDGIASKELAEICRDGECARLVSMLHEKGAISTTATNEQVSKQDEKTYKFLLATVPDPIKAWQLVSTAHIAIVGCGGVGSIVAQELVAMGIRRFTLIDGDVVEESNLNRQTVYAHNDIGKKKVHALAERLQALRTDLNLTLLDRWIVNEPDLDDAALPSVDLLVAAADKPSVAIQHCLVTSAKNTDTPCMLSGVGLLSGRFGPLLSDYDSKCAYLTALERQIDDVLTENLRAVEGSLCASNHLISSLMAWDIFHFIVQENYKVKSLNRVCTINFAHMSITADAIE